MAYISGFTEIPMSGIGWKGLSGGKIHSGLIETLAAKPTEVFLGTPV